MENFNPAVEFSKLSREEQNQIIKRAKDQAREKQGELRYWTQWVGIQIFTFSVLSFLSGFGSAALFSLITLPLIGEPPIGPMVAVIMVLLWPFLSRKLARWHFRLEIANQLAAG